MKELPTLDELLGIDKYNFSVNDRNYLISVLNNFGEGAMLDEIEKILKKEKK
jgi:hypothetical protein